MSSGEVRYPNTNGVSKYPLIRPQTTQVGCLTHERCRGNGSNLRPVSIRTSLTQPGPVAANIKSEASRAGDELRDLRNTKVPSATTATGQQLTRYHSLLYSLLSWEQPRATAVSFATVVVFIFAARFLPLLRWVFKFMYLSLGFTLAAEIAGKAVFSQGLAGSFRPRKYFTIPRETLEANLEDLQQLLDFFSIEFQRVLFVENIFHSIAAFSAAFLAYWLIKILPFWGLSLIGTFIAYLGPLVYMNNREIIDAQIEHAQSIVNSQAHQLRDIAEERTAHATGLMRQYVDDYSAKVQQYMPSPNRRSMSPEMAKVPAALKTESPEPEIKTSDFPEAPRDEPVGEQAQSMEPSQQEPLLA